MPDTNEQMQSWLKEIPEPDATGDKLHPQMEDWLKQIPEEQPRSQGGPHPKLKEWLSQIPEQAGQPPATGETDAEGRARVYNMRKGAGLSGDLGPSMTADPNDREALVKHARGVLDTSISPTLTSGVAQAAEGTLSLAARFFGARDTADYLNKVRESYETAAQEKAGGGVSGFLKQAARGGMKFAPTIAVSAVTGGVGGLPMLAAQSADEAAAKGREAGLSGQQLQDYMLMQGAVDTVVYGTLDHFHVKGLVTKIGRPAAEAVAKGLIQGARRVGISMASQADASVIANIGHAVNSVVSGVDPKALDLDRLTESTKEAAAQGAVAAGFITAAHLSGIKVAEKWSAKNPGQAKALAEKTGDVSRKDAIKNGMPPEVIKRKEDRNDFRDLVKEHTQRSFEFASVQEPKEASKEPLAKDIPEQYKVPQKFVDDVKSSASKLNMPEGKDLETLYLADGNAPAVEGEYLGIVDGKRVMAVEAEAVKLRLQNDPSKKSEYGEFTNAGNHSRYDFIPEDQLWIARSVEHKELPKWAAHEDIEDHLMSKHDVPYDKANAEHPKSAHDIATDIEQKWADKSPGGDVHLQMDPSKESEETPSDQEVKDRMPGKSRFTKARAALHDLIALASPVVAGGDVTRALGHAMRRHAAEARQWDESLRVHAREIQDDMYKLTPKEDKQFLMDYEDGKPQSTGRIDAAAKLIHDEYVAARERIQELGTGKLADFYEHYFKHLFKHTPESEVIANRLVTKTLRKSGMFRKRKYPTYREAFEAGLEADGRPLDILFKSIHQMNEYVAKTRDFQSQKELGLLSFVPEEDGKNYLREGYKIVADPMYAVKTKGDVTQTEAFDEALVNQLESSIYSLGGKHKRTLKTTEGELGSFTPSSKLVTTKFGSDVRTLGHELGHLIGDTFGLYEYMRESGQEGLMSEMDKLADLRFQGKDVTEAFRKYVRDPSEMEAVMMEAWVGAPDLMEREAPNVTKVWKEFLQANETLRPLLSLDRSLLVGVGTAEVKLPGVRHLGNWSMPIDAAKMVENQLSQGLRSNENRAIRGTYNTLRMYGNALRSSALALSGRHALFITGESMGTNIGIGISQIARGENMKGLKTVLATPLAPKRAFTKGKEIRSAMQGVLDKIEDPKLREEVEDVITAGGSSRMDPIFKNNATKALKDTWHDLRNSDAWDQLTPAMKIPMQALFSGIELSSYPTMEFYVPVMKLGVFAEYASDLHARNARTIAGGGEGLSDFQMHEQFTQKWDSVENRLGEMTQSNKFWNQYLKDSCMLAYTSTTWNVGTLSEYGGAILDVLTTKKRMARGGELLSDRQAYVLGSAVKTAAIGSIMTFLMTGHGPRSPRDLLYWPTGRKNPDGSEERISAVDYLTDMVSWYMNPLKTHGNKLNPMWGTMGDLYHNKDFYGGKIMNEDDPRAVQFKDAMVHILKSWEPFSLKNFQQMKKKGLSTGAAAVFSGVVGAHTAPSSITQSPALQLANKYIGDKMPSTPRTKAEVEHSEKKATATAAWREGKEPTEENLNGMSMADRKAAFSSSRVSPLQSKVRRLSLKQGLEVYGKGNEKEKKELRSILIRKRARMKTISDDLQKDYDNTIGE